MRRGAEVKFVAVKFDPAFWIDVFKRTRSNATCLSAGGYIAYYPSKVPLHYVSKFIGDTDPFGTLVDGARRLGMHRRTLTRKLEKKQVR